MPELPEVETVVRGLEQALLNDKFTKITLNRPDLRFPFAPNFASALTGKSIESISRRAKYLLLTLKDGTVLIGHLGMSGSFRIENAQVTAVDKHDHIIFETEKGVRVRYHDPRRFGFMLLTTLADMENHPQLKNIGPEPLGNEFSGPILSAALKGRKGPIKTALLDQKVVAGVGNIYACEALYRARISPKRIAGTITGKRAERLAEAIKQVLREAILSGGSTLRNYSRTDGELGYFQHQFLVYDQEGSPCPSPGCEKPIQRIVQSGRSTFYCSSCQR
ncbi:bifunctional DNA-formamidopyrimidine glycosylase/DNA-(apurinic or apyrimidinic site) lyase [Sneathiella limimaris]|uniref:bifunctional DNA-formamidopyrimidine glycosylase/DNA-(apurinic or apyrimidinic site) lyase n=1 Tax=Sneathiella limimaris TaxID=1964213 RepID=UPI00146C0C65|nr:bifunctional DNA-formamidopyrimidine glycosylase/DNA-(apurinic or apyrimidinic site) lyase [Sneathiella limimaris]